MKATKKIVGAACALVAAVALSAGSTFAWFASNTSVSATGMSVAANAPTTFLISNTVITESQTDADRTYASTVTCSNDSGTSASSFNPVAYAKDFTAFYKLTNAGMTTVNGSGVATAAVEDDSETTQFTSAKVGTSNAYESTTEYYHETVWVKFEGVAASTKQIKATVAYTDTSTTTPIRDAMHVVFVVGSNKTTIDMGGTKVTGSLATLTANAAGTQIDIYYFLSGNDTDCKNANLTTNATLGITITFDEYSAS